MIAKAIPFFFLLIGLELLVAAAMRRKVYRVADSISDMSAGVLQQLGGVAYGFVVVLTYAWFVSHHSLPAWWGVEIWQAWPNEVGSNWPQVIATWTVAFLGYDFAYYWAHRKMHEINLGWATHVPHHSSEEYNFAVALRQGAFQRFFSLPFFVPFAILGVSPVAFFVSAAISTLYQFFVHTRLVGRLGPIEWIFNTPSHHRVHHGKDPKYIDKNHAGVLIIWDRMFGTFQREEEEPAYGTVEPLNSWNPLTTQFKTLAGVAAQAARSRSFRDAWRTVWGRPGWRPDSAGGPAVALEIPPRERSRKYDHPLPWSMKLYALAHFAPLVPLTVLLLSRAPLPDATLVTLGLAGVVTMSTLGAVLEQRRWGLVGEIARLVTLGATALVLATSATASVEAGIALGLAETAAIVGTAAVSLGWLVLRWPGPHSDARGARQVETGPPNVDPPTAPPETSAPLTRAPPAAG